MNDCQIQTETSLVDSNQSMSESKAMQLEKLHERLANIEGILDSNNEFVQPQNQSREQESIAQISNIESQSNIDQSIVQSRQISEQNTSHMGIQTHSESPNFTQEEVDQLLHKLKKAHDLLSERDAVINKYESVQNDLHSQIDQLELKFEDQQKMYDEHRQQEEHKNGIIEDLQAQIKHETDLRAQAETQNARYEMELGERETEIESTQKVQNAKEKALLDQNSKLSEKVNKLTKENSEHQASVKSLKQ